MKTVMQDAFLKTIDEFQYKVEANIALRSLAGTQLSRWRVKKGKDYRISSMINGLISENFRISGDIMTDIYWFRKANHAVQFKLWLPDQIPLNLRMVIPIIRRRIRDSFTNSFTK